jgi:DNA-binding transcriptional LysR family regulator
MQDLNWNLLRHVLALARNDSLVRAAQALGVNETTIGRRVAEAEQRLGARLFTRHRGRFRPTEAGSLAITCGERVEREVQAMLSSVAGTDGVVAGTVRVTSVPIVVNRLLVPDLPTLLTTHPDLRVELIAEPRDLSLTKREADIALRLARPVNELRAVARRIGQLDYAVYGPTQSADDSLPWITYEDRMADLPQWKWIAAQAGATRRSSLMVNDAEAIMQGVRAGLGRSLLPIAVAEREAGLRRIDANPPALSRELWLMGHPEMRDLMRVRVVMDWLITIAGRWST